MKRYVAGVDIGGTNFRIGIVDEQGELYGFERKPSAIFKSGDAVAVLAQEIGVFLAKHAAEMPVQAVAIGFPSIVSKDKRMLYSTPNLKGFDGIDLKGALEQQLSLPVFIDRDVNFLLQNDIWQLKLDADKTILGFYVGTGFGNAIYLEGKFYTGKNGVAGELGHIPLYGVEEACTCGNIGCSETRCSGRYLEALTRLHFPDTPIGQVFTAHGDDPRVQAYVRDLAVPIATEINLLDPDYAVIAGGVVFMPDFPRQLLEQAVRERVRRPYPAQNLSIYYSEHTQESGVLGGGGFVHRVLAGNDSM